MQNFRLLSAIAAIAVLVSGAAYAAQPSAFRGEATLATPSTKEAVVSGVTWKCEGATCQAFAERHSTLDSHVRECRKVAAALGPLSSYRSRGREMSAGNLNVCNRGATVQNAAASAPSGN